VLHSQSDRMSGVVAGRDPSSGPPFCPSLLVELLIPPGQSVRSSRTDHEKETRKKRQSEAMQSGFCRADHLTFRLFDGRGGLLGEAVSLDAPPTISLLHTPFSSLFLLTFSLVLPLCRSSFVYTPFFPPMTKTRYRPRRRVFFGRHIASARLHAKYLSRPPFPVPRICLSQGMYLAKYVNLPHERIQQLLFNQPWSPPPTPRRPMIPAVFPPLVCPLHISQATTTQRYCSSPPPTPPTSCSFKHASLTRTLVYPIPLFPSP
jgi:hypothetical protein